MGGDLTVASEPGQAPPSRSPCPRRFPRRLSQQDAVRSRNQPSGARGHGPVVLVIDDDPAVRELMQRSLSKEGYRVEVAADGRTGLEMAKRLKPSVITLDVMMPGMDGWAVLSALKADPDTADIPVIMLTIVDDKNMGFALGAADYFTKPIDWQRLGAVLKKHRQPAGDQTVLIVEDDEPTREMLRRTLQKEGWQVREAANGRLGLEQLAHGLPGLILLDLMMPEMDGFDFMEELRKRPDCAHVPGDRHHRQGSDRSRSPPSQRGCGPYPRQGRHQPRATDYGSARVPHPSDGVPHLKLPPQDIPWPKSSSSKTTK